jgi:hypothetical protein
MTGVREVAAGWRSALAVLLATVLAASVAACGGSHPGVPPSPVGPAFPRGVGPPTQFAIHSQRVTIASNEIVLGWSGSTPAYRLSIGSRRGASDVHVVDLAAAGYTFVAPRTANSYFARVSGIDGELVTPPTADLTISTLDLREVIDALFFDAGPMSEFRAIQPGTKQAAVWVDGARLSVPVSREAGERIRALAQAAVDDYAAIVGGAVTGTAVLVDDDMHALTRPEQLPAFTIATRLFPPGCPSTASGCAFFGPAPAGPNASIVTLTSPGVTSTVAHEFGHAYGLRHIRPAASDRPEFRFLMSTPASSDTLSDPERAAIAAARAGGIRGGTTRDEALAAGLVLPYSGG